MATNRNDNDTRAPRWPHVQAWLLACAVFPLIWIGGLVTTYEAGMSVVDWPTTYGHWFYSLQTWFYGMWDMFLEHGHRLWAQFVGLLAILAAAAIGVADRRRWMGWIAAALLAGVAIQGTLGGLRVLLDERMLAKVHGCTAAAYFALCAATVAMTSQRWRMAPVITSALAARLQRLAVAAAALLFLDIILGVQLRHAIAPESPGWFVLWLWFKLITAGAVGGVALVVWLTARCLPDAPFLVRRARLLGLLVAAQLSLGGATWLVKYGVPAWFRDYVSAVEYTIEQQSGWQVNVRTAHVAVGSLAFATAVVLAVWSYRLFERPSR